MGNPPPLKRGKLAHSSQHADQPEPVRLLLIKRTVAFEAELRNDGRRIGQRCGHDLDLRCTETVFDLRVAVMEVAAVLLRRVIEMQIASGDRPLDFERNHHRNRRACASYGVLEAAVIIDVEILHFVGCGASSQVNGDISWINDRCPEEAVISDTGVKIMDLGIP